MEARKMNIFEIPLTSEPNQNFKCSVPISSHNELGDGENKTFIFDIKYNSEAEYWVMTVTDDLTNRILVDSVPLLCV